MRSDGDHRVLIVDDEVPLLQTLATAARARGYGVDTADSGGEAWDRLTRTRYDVVVTDLRMPGLAGPELMDRIARHGIITRVVVITAYASLEVAVDCLRKGAVDFLIKPFEVEAFLLSLERALERPLSFPGPDWEGMAQTHGLTPRELEVIRMLHETGMSNRELARRLGVSPHTIKTHLRVAFRKLGVGNRTELLRLLGPPAGPRATPPPPPGRPAPDLSWEE